MLPFDVLRFGEHFSQEIILRAHADIDDAVSQSQLVAAHEAFVECSLRITIREELDVAIHCLSIRSIHDDMNGGANVCCKNLRIAAEETEHFLFVQRVRDL